MQSSRRPSTSRRWALPCACLCLGALGLVLIPLSDGLDEAVRSYSWPSTEGTLLSAERGRARYGTSYETAQEEVWVELGYAYTAADSSQHAGHRFDVSTTPGRGWRHRHSLIACNIALHAMRDAPAVRVYYDPAKPEAAVLLPGIGFSQSGWLALVTALLGATLLLVRYGLEITKDPPQGSFVAGLIAWLVCVPLGWVALAGGLGAVYYTLGLSAPPVWPGLVFLGVCLVQVLIPSLVRVQAVQWAIAIAIIGLVLFGLAGGLLAAIDAEAEVEYTVEADELVRRLADPHPRVREYAAHEIRERRRPLEAVESLRALGDDPDPEVREAARRALRVLEAP